MNDLLDRSARRALVVRQGDRPRLNMSLARLLGEAFPELDIDDLDVLAAVRSRPTRWLGAIATGAIEYASPLLARRSTAKRAVVRSRSFSRSASEIARTLATPETHLFTIQSQSLFTAAVPGIPHFVYTDHAHLANIRYPGFDRGALLGGRQLAREIEVYEAAEAVFTRSRHIADVLTSAYGLPTSRVAVVGVGPNIPTDERVISTEWHGGRIVFVGADWQRKGGPYLVEAFRRLRADHPAATLDIVGCDPGIDGPGITVHGRVASDGVARLLGASDVFCLPTLAEPFGVAFLEAMHAGIPIVGTDLGAVPELVGSEHTGLLTKAQDVDDLHRQLDRLLRDVDFARTLGARGREVAAEHYEWPVVMERIRSEILRRLPPRSGAT